jgi:hypothetical protein
MSDQDMHRIELRAQSIEELRSYLHGADLDLGCRPVVRREADAVVTEVYGTLPQLDRLRTARAATGVTLRVMENATQTGLARQAEVGSGNRFSRASRLAGQQPPSGLGIKE